MHHDHCNKPDLCNCDCVTCKRAYEAANRPLASAKRISHAEAHLDEFVPKLVQHMKIFRSNIPEMSVLTDKEVQDLYVEFSQMRWKTFWCDAPDWAGFQQWAIHTPIQQVIMFRPENL